MIPSELVLCQLLYIIPSIVLYIVEIYVMFFGVHKFKFKNSSFNKIFFVYAVNNIIADILYYFFFRMGSAPIFFGFCEQLLGFHPVLVLLWYVLFHTSMATNLMDLVLSFNRFTAVAIPVKYKRFWNDKIIWVLVSTVMFPCISFWTIPIQEPTLVYDNISDTYNMSPGRKSPVLWISPTNVLGMCVALCCIGCLICNTYVGFKLYRWRDSTIEQTYAQDKVYFIFIMCVFVNQILSCATEWMVSRVSNQTWLFIMIHQFIIADLSYLLPAWILFLTNSTLRQCIYEVYIRSRILSIVQTTRIGIPAIDSYETP